MKHLFFAAAMSVLLTTAASADGQFIAMSNTDGFSSTQVNCQRIDSFDVSISLVQPITIIHFGGTTVRVAGDQTAAIRNCAGQWSPPASVFTDDSRPLWLDGSSYVVAPNSGIATFKNVAPAIIEFGSKAPPPTGGH